MSEQKNAVSIIELESRITYLENLVRELRSLPVATCGDTGLRGPKGDTGGDGAPGPTGPKGDPGQIGKPGNIDAAVANAEKAVDARLASLVERVETYAKQEGQYRKESIESLRRELDQFRTSMRQSFSDFQAADKDRVENCIVDVLAEYGVVSSHDGRVIQA